MTDEIKPALTAGEWAQECSHPHNLPTAWIERDGNSADGNAACGHLPDVHSQVVLCIGDGVSTLVEVYAIEDIPAILALTNAALPDDSPYKITRADVGLIEFAAPGCDMEDDYHAVLAIAAKLAALLPPK